MDNLSFLKKRYNLIIVEDNQDIMIVTLFYDFVSRGLICLTANQLV